jgi:arylsulfatase A
MKSRNKYFVFHTGIGILFSLVFPGPCKSNPPQDSSRPPNIIFILADDLGYGALGCYGQEKIQTPNIDRLAAEGMKFTQAYAGSHSCAPSRSVLMTGLHTGHTPVRGGRRGEHLLDEDVTVAEVLKQAGYTTSAFGKWGLGLEGSPGHPNRQGFDEFFGYLHQVHAHFYHPYFLWRNEAKFYLRENEGKKQVRYAHDEIHAQAMDFIARNRARPFFAYIPYTLPHTEIVVPEDSVQPYRGKFIEEPLPDHRPGYKGADEPYATYAGMISRLDRHVGEIMARLKRLGIDEETVVFFSSDNGPQGKAWQRVTDFFDGNGPLRGYKAQFYEGGIRVPLVVSWPGKIAAGSESHLATAFWDFLPTAAELAGVEISLPVDGISIVPTLTGSGEPQATHAFLFWEFANAQITSRAARMGKWKGVQSTSDSPWELYDLEKDPEESNNIIQEHPEIVEEVDAYIVNARTERRSYPVPKESPTAATYVR